MKLLNELLHLKEAMVKMTPELIDVLNTKADGADEVEHNGVKYRRSGPKNSVSQPGPWKQVV